MSSLDTVRGIASFIVLLDQCYWTFPDASRTQLASSIWSRPIIFFTNGQAAVIIFFMLSGYVLSFPFFCGAVPSYPRYLFKRFCRIYIPFAVAILIAALLCQIIDIRDPVAGAGDWLNRQMGPTGMSPSVLAGHLLMSGTARDMALDSVMWTLVYEMRVSLIFPLLIVLCRNTGVALGASAIMLVGATRLLIDLGLTQHPVAVDNFWVTIVWTVRVVPYFVVGILLNKHSKSIRELLLHIPERRRIALIVVPIIIFTISHRGYFSVRRDVLYDFGAAMVIVLALDIPSISATLNRGALLWLGRMLYSVYLVHTLVLAVMVHALIGLVPLWFIVLSAIGVTLVTAAVMHRFVEVPAMTLGRRVARGAEPLTEIARAEIS